MPCRWAVYATLQSVFRHRNSIGALVGLQFQACHNIIGTQPYGVSRLLAVASLRLFLTFPALALSLYDGNKRYVYVRSFLAPMDDAPLPFSSGTGERVWHPIFGVGTVLTMGESGECRVAFNGGEFSLRRSALRWEVEEGEGGE